MTTTITPTTTIVPVKADGQSWEDFAEAIKSAEEAEKALLMTACPTPEMTAERGTDAWGEEWKAQYEVSNKRTSLLMRFNSQLIVAIGKALASEVDAFRSLDIDYAGSGDSGESCSIQVYLDRPALTNNPDGSRRFFTHEENQVFNTRQDEALALLPEELTEWLDETAWAIAYDAHPGFEIDAGGFGSLVVERADEDDLASPLQLTISHTERVEQSYADQVLA